MKKTIEETWREGFLYPDALVAPKINDLYSRKSQHLADKIQRMLGINEIAILIGSPLLWAFLSAFGIPYTGAILGVTFLGLLAVRRLYVTRFDAPDNSLDSYHYIKAFHVWLKDRMARSKRVQRHIYAVCFVALAMGILASEPARQFFSRIAEDNPGISLVFGVPLIVLAGVVVMTIVVELLGGAIFDSRHRRRKQWLVATLTPSTPRLPGPWHLTARSTFTHPRTKLIPKLPPHQKTRIGT